LRIRRLVQRQSKPGAAFGDFGASRNVILANAAAENEGVETAERCSKRADFAHDAIDEQRNGFNI
jgi:hypothetical protein